MSNWTHVAGIVRIDDINPLDTEKANDFFDKFFGKQLSFHDSGEKWKDAADNPQDYLPMGSEGSLTMSVWVNPNKSHMAAYTVSIFGDLRDHDDPQSIVDWFEAKCGMFWVRNAVIVVENELKGIITWTYEKERE